MSGEHLLGGLTTDLHGTPLASTPSAALPGSDAETRRAPPYRDSSASGSGQHRAAQLENIERARRDVSLAPTFDKLVEATLGLTASSEKLQTEVRRLVGATYVILGLLAASEALTLFAMLRR